jgi:hypothetical protein
VESDEELLAVGICMKTNTERCDQLGMNVPSAEGNHKVRRDKRL